MNWRVLMVACAFCLAGCSNDVAGQVYFDANQDGEPNELVGMAGVPVELYLVSASSSGFSLGGNYSKDDESDKDKKASSSSKQSVTKGVDVPTLDDADDEDDFSDEPSDDSGSSAMDANLSMLLPSTYVPMHASSGNGDFVEMKLTDYNGHFRFDGLEPGTYEVRIADDQGPLAQGYRVTSGSNPQEVEAIFLGADVSVGLFRQGLNVVGGDCPSTIEAGETVRCSLSYRNVSPTPMGDVRIRARLPHGLSVVPHADGAYLPNSHEVEWTAGFVGSQSLVHIAMDLEVDALTVAERSGTIEWELYALNLDGAQSIGSSPLTMYAQAGMQIDLHAPDTVPLGKRIPYEVAVRNYGTMELGQARLVISLPEGVSAVESTGGYDSDTRELHWPLGRIAAGETIVRYFSFQADTKQTYQPEVSLEASSLDPEVISTQVSATTVQ